MCGIVGYIGRREAYPILMQGLHRLEYRGYDSAGVALLSGNRERVIAAANKAASVDSQAANQQQNTISLNIYKAKGKVQDLERVALGKDCSGTLGIAHTRWATHGVPSEQNAHPHLSQSGNLTLVHNGIIENYGILREQLLEHGYHFQSETDTEVLVQLIDYVMSLTGEDLPTSVRLALKQVYGAYAIAVIDRRQPGQIVAARKSSPLAIGIGENELFLASDASPIAEYTKQIVYLRDEEIAILRDNAQLDVYNLDGAQTDAEVKEVDIDISMLSKGGFPHFMLKEIFDQPAVLRDCMSGRVVDNIYTSYSVHNGEVKAKPQIILSALTQHRRELLSAKRIIIVGCGTSWHAGLIGKQLIEHFCRIPVEVAYASEFRYSDPVVSADDVVLAVSQSGETADTLAAVQLAKERGAMIFGIVNGVGSSIARESTTGTYIHVGPEIGVASTKAFSGQVMVLTMLSLALGFIKGTVSEEEYDHVLAELLLIPDKLQKVLAQSEHIAQVAKRIVGANSMLYLGRGWNYPVALEGALKLKEISYIHAEGYPAAEMKHGPIALVDEDMPVVFLATKHELYHKVISNMQEVISRHGHIIAVVTEGDTEVRAIADDVIEIPDTPACLVPLLSIIPLQLLSYHVAVAKGLNVDQPRNLAKSVTVE